MEMESSSPNTSLQKLKVADLKKLLKEKNLSVTGNKADLIERLGHVGVEAASENIADIAEGNTSEEKEELDDDILNDHEDEIEENEENEPEKENDVLKSSSLVDTTETEKPSENAAEATSEKEDDESAVTITKISAPEPVAVPDKLVERQKRFGAVSSDAKKKARAERFGIPVADAKDGSTASAKISNDKSPGVTSSAVSADDLEKLKKRSERFGTVTATALSKVRETDKLKRRAERFGGVSSPKLAKLDTDENLQKRKERFGLATTDDTDEKKKKRAERFQAAK